MASGSGSCENFSDKFCYICGKYCAVKQSLTRITYYVKQLYLAYFGMKVCNQDKSWAPHKVCKSRLSTESSYGLCIEAHKSDAVVERTRGTVSITVRSKDQFDE
uniref:Uncharacterized protein n=1 Tax=Phlebotomus papatasi TaxID=29031 RepID=A0A1B0DNG3_PHLPP